MYIEHAACCHCQELVAIQRDDLPQACPYCERQLEWDWVQTEDSFWPTYFSQPPGSEELWHRVLFGEGKDVMGA